MSVQFWHVWHLLWFISMPHPIHVCPVDFPQWFNAFCHCRLVATIELKHYEAFVDKHSTPATKIPFLAEMFERAQNTAKGLQYNEEKVTNGAKKLNVDWRCCSTKWN